MYYEMTIAGHKRQLPICPISDTLSIAGFVMFGDSEITVDAARLLLEKAPEFDVIVTAESKGIPLAHEMSRQSNFADYVVMRKAQGAESAEKELKTRFARVETVERGSGYRVFRAEK